MMTMKTHGVECPDVRPQTRRDQNSTMMKDLLFEEEVRYDDDDGDDHDENDGDDDDDNNFLGKQEEIRIQQ